MPGYLAPPFGSIVVRAATLRDPQRGAVGLLVLVWSIIIARVAS